MLEFSDAEIRAKAAHLGYDPAALLPPQLAKVKVLLMEERRAAEMAAHPTEDGPRIAGQITIRPGAGIELDGKPLPAAAEAVDIRVSTDPAVPSTVRLTLLAHTVQTIKE